MNVSYTLPTIVSYNGVQCRNLKIDIERMEKFEKLLNNHRIIGWSTDGDEYTFFLFKINEDDDDYAERDSLFHVCIYFYDIVKDPVYEMAKFCHSKESENMKNFLK